MVGRGTWSRCGRGSACPATSRPSKFGTTIRPPASLAFATGTATLSATPLGWATAQFIRLAWSIQAGRPVEQPATVACRYAGACPR